MTVSLYTPTTTPISIFLAGAIDNNTAVDWQTDVFTYLSEHIPHHIPVILYNPRRSDWDSDFKCKLPDYSVGFHTQVHWEMNYLNHVDIVIMNFEANSVAPISLLELGLHSSGNKMVVCCDPQFWRSGNVDIVCKQYNIPIVTTKSQLYECIIGKVVTLYNTTQKLTLSKEVYKS